MFVGLDYHQAFVQMCVMDAIGTVLSNRKCANSATALVEAAHRLMQYDPRWSTLGQSLKVRGKPGSEKATAIANL